MKEYFLSSGEVFNTIVIPKGTLLFRGIDLYTDRPHPEFLFMDLFGQQDEDGYYCMDPHENKFFYPAPFVSDCVSRYAVHVVYHTNYEIEVVLLLNPSLNARNKRGTETSAILRCDKISEFDQCGKHRKQYDPCLSLLLLKEFPHIQGYIAIAEKDAKIFQKGQIPAFMKDVPEAINFVKPMIVADSRGLQSVPEIVLFPFHTRPETLISYGIHPRAVEPDMFSYAFRHRAKLNYFPLAFITENGMYSYKDLFVTKKLLELSSSERSDINFDSPLTKNMVSFMKAGLQKNALFINNTPYTFSIDLRTGFYVLDIPENRRLNYTTKKISILSSDTKEPTIIPFHYPSNVKKKLHSSLQKTLSEETLENNLNRIYASYSKHYQFDKGDPKTFQSVYKMDLALPRPELDIPKRRYTQKRSR